MIARCITLLITVAVVAPALHAQTLAELRESDPRPEHVEADERIGMQRTIAAAESLARQTRTLGYRATDDGVELVRAGR